ncbi:MAG: hypothetical protein QOE92_1675 [Chloroflexota bacterium]|jgi:hypothetical protein|nr:hypothetical protein [Chloroflexota bacterium]
MATRTITRHAVQRYIERVDRSATPATASRHLADLVTGGRVRPKPRSWTVVDPAPGKVFIYSASEPDVCLVATRDAVVTVLTRDLCRGGRGHVEHHRVAHHRHATLVPPPAWNPRMLEEAA